MKWRWAFARRTDRKAAVSSEIALRFTGAVYAKVDLVDTKSNSTITSAKPVWCHFHRARDWYDLDTTPAVDGITGRNADSRGQIRNALYPTVVPIGHDRTAVAEVKICYTLHRLRRAADQISPRDASVYSTIDHELGIALSAWEQCLKLTTLYRDGEHAIALAPDLEADIPKRAPRFIDNRDLIS